MNFRKSSLAAGILLSMALSGVHAQDGEVPRTPDGKPDLQGVWSNQTLTPLTRSRELGETRALTLEQAQHLLLAVADDHGVRFRHDLQHVAARRRAES